jgi:WD40 repeat protein
VNSTIPSDIGRHRQVRALLPLVERDTELIDAETIRIAGSVAADVKTALQMIDYIEGIAIHGCLTTNTPLETLFHEEAGNGVDTIDVTPVTELIVQLENDNPLESILDLGVQTKAAMKSLLESVQRREQTTYRRHRTERSRESNTELKRSIESAHEGALSSMVATPDGKSIVTSGADGEVFIWNTETWNRKGIGADSSDALSYSDRNRPTLAISTDGEWVACGYDGYPVIEVEQINGEKRKRHMNYDKIDRKHFGEEQYAEGICRYYQGCEHVPSAMAFSPDGKYLAVGGTMSPLIVWPTAPRAKPIILEGADVGDYAQSLAFSPDGSLLVKGTGNSGPLKMWDTSTWQEKKLPKKLSEPTSDDICSLTFSADGSQLLLGGGFTHARVKHLDMSADTKKWRDLGYHGKRNPDPCNDHEYVRSVGFLPGETIAYSTGSKDDLIKFWDIEKRKLVRTITANQGGIESAVISGNRLVSGGADGSLKVWNTEGIEAL